ncbi:MAG TPA: DMT family transporter [Bacteroidales bacterium]|nr:DMT family transporter [Bacteroidales bacterium]
MSKRWLPLVLLLALVLVWGSSFMLIKRGLRHFDAATVGALRVTLSFLFLLPLALTRISRVSKKEFGWLTISGIIGSLLPAYLFAFAQTGLDSGTAGLLNALTPLFTLLVGIFFFRLKVRWLQAAGVLIGLIGAIGLISSSGGKGMSFNLPYASLIILATILYAFNVNLIKSKLHRVDSISITSITFLVPGIIASVILFTLTPVVDKLTHEPTAWTGLGYIALLAIMGTALALMVFNMLIKLTGPVFASSVTYLIPIIALMWGVVDGEFFSMMYLLWIGMILGGVLLVNYRHKRKVPAG